MVFKTGKTLFQYFSVNSFFSYKVVSGKNGSILYTGILPKQKILRKDNSYNEYVPGYLPCHDNGLDLLSLHSYDPYYLYRHLSLCF